MELHNIKIYSILPKRSIAERLKNRTLLRVAINFPMTANPPCTE
jgi:hypothetical protein